MLYDALRERGAPEAVAPGLQKEGWDAYRKELVRLLGREVYGFAPPPPAYVKAEEILVEKRAWAGKADHIELQLKFPTPKGEFAFPVHLILPLSEKKLPMILYISFTSYPIGRYGPLEEIVDAGYAMATFCYNDVTRDEDDGFGSGLAAMYDRDPDDPHAWGKIAMWAFAASRAMDYVRTLDRIDPDRIFCVGHSRLGKTSLWCGAQDERFAAAVSNDSGCSGAAITRDKQGERVADIVNRFPHWFCKQYRQYAGREHEMPFDQNLLLAAVCPRPLYVASATEDLWCDPQSEYLSCLSASRAYELLGLDGLVGPRTRYPEAGETFHAGTIGYHLRQGTHFLSRYDWIRFLQFMDRHLPAKG